MPDSENAKPGLSHSIKQFASSLLVMGQTRLELLANDLEEERAWLSSMLVWTVITLFFSAMAVILATLFIVVYCWDSNRLLALGLLIAVFVLAAVFSGRVANNMSRGKPRLFSASIAELAKDREPLEPRHE